MSSRADRDRRVQRFRAARRDRGLAVLEGFHALKHALRFGAEPSDVVATDPDRVQAMAERLAPDIADRLAGAVRPVPADLFAELAPHPPPTGVIALARRPPVTVEGILGAPAEEPILLLDRPRHLGNLGAAVRVAAAAGAAGVLTTGEHDPWHPTALRGAAGLHYALPVAGMRELPPSDRPLIAIDPDGRPLAPGELPPRAVLAFGSERYGLGAGLSARADDRVGIPMRAGVSSLNLATAVAVVLYAWRGDRPFPTR